MSVNTTVANRRSVRGALIEPQMNSSCASTTMRQSGFVKPEVVGAGHLLEDRARDLRGEPLARRERHHAVVDVMSDERGHRDLGQAVGGIECPEAERLGQDVGRGG